MSVDKINRRRFVQTSAATLALSASSRVFAQDQPSENLHFAIIGAGRQGRHMTKRLLEVPSTRLVAACEINPSCVEELKQTAPDIRVYEDLQQLLSEEKDLQAVVIGLPEHNHAEAAIAAMEAGLDVFCEKPMAYSLEQSRAMIATRDKTGRVLQIGQQRRSNPLYYLAERLIQQEGVIGDVMRVDAFWDRYGDWKRPLPEIDKDFQRWGYPTLNHLVNWRLYREYGHGLMTENGTHQMDASGWLLGGRRPKRVCGMGATRYKDDRETHDIVSAEYMFDGDVIVRFTQDFHQGFNYEWSYGELFLGSEGALRVTAEQTLVLYDLDRNPTTVDIARLGDVEMAGRTIASAEMQAAQADREAGGLRTFSYFNAMRIFSDCVRTRQSPTCTGEIGHNSIVSTIIGTKAQLSNEYQQFDDSMFV